MKFAVLLLILPTLSLSLTCDEFISSVQQKANTTSADSTVMTAQESLFFQSSAAPRSALGLGDKDACETDPSMKYYVALRVYYVTLGFKTGVDHGVCLPQECSTLYESQSQDLLTKLFNARQWKIAQGDQLELYDPEKPIASKSAVFYISCLLFAFFILSSIFSTVIAQIHRAKEKKNLKIKSPVQHHSFHDEDHKHEHNHDHEHDHEHDHDHEHTHDVDHEHDHDHDHEHHGIDHHEAIHAPAGHPVKPLHWFFKSFDLRENFTALVKTAKELHLDENMEVLDILKIGTVCYVVYANSFGPYTKLLVDKESYTEFFTTSMSKLQMSADFTSEYFFVMGGFLFSHKLIPQIASAGKFGVLTFLRLLRQRFFVIYPLFIMSFLFYWQIIPHTFSGPLSYNYQWEVEACDKVAWSKFLFIENLTNGYTIKNAGMYCVPTVWYVPAEFQVYIIGVLVFALFVKYRRIGFLVSVLLYFQGFALAVAAFYKYDLTYDLTYPTLYEVKFKWIPCKRWENFFLGAIFGMMYYEYSHHNKKNIFYLWEKSPLISYVTMFFGAGLNMFLVFFLVSRETAPDVWTEDLRHMWFAIRIVLTGLSVMLFFMPMAAHRTFLLKKLLTLRFFQIFSRYTVDLYIFHQGINYAMYFSSTEDVETFSHTEICVHTVVIILIGEVVATTTHLCIERPLIKLEAKLAEKSSRYHPMAANVHVETVSPLHAKKGIELTPGVTRQLTSESQTPNVMSPPSSNPKMK